jgi:small subunit ribosomal protein S1
MPDTKQPEPPGEISGREEFARLLDEYTYHSPERGQILEGTILDIGEEEIILDVGLKRDAFVPRGDLERLDADTLRQLKIGETVKVYVLRPADQGGDLIVSINKALQASEWERARRMLESGELVQGEVVGYNKGGLLAKFGRLSGFIPQSHVVSMANIFHGGHREAKAACIGHILTLKVIEVDENRNRLVLSERAARESARKARLEGLQIGQVITGRVVGLVEYGAFIDIGDIDGLIHVSKLARGYVKEPSAVLAIGDAVTVRVDQIDVARERVSLNRAALLPDPWETVGEHYHEDDVTTGIVTRIARFGAFVALPHDMEGLVHTSQMAGILPDQLREGDEVRVRITRIDRERRRIDLSLDVTAAEEPEG